MSLKDFIGLKVEITVKDEKIKGIIADFYLRGDSREGGRQIERFVILSEKNTLFFRDMDQASDLIFIDDEKIQDIRNKLLNVKEEDEEELPREQLLDLEE